MLGTPMGHVGIAVCLHPSIFLLVLPQRQHDFSPLLTSFKRNAISQQQVIEGMLDQLAYHNIYHVHATNIYPEKSPNFVEGSSLQNHYFYNLRPPQS